MNIDFGRVLTRAWEITWKYKILWIFGFLAALLQGGSSYSSSGNANYSFNAGDFYSNPGTLPPEIQNIIDRVSNIDWNTAQIYIAIACVCLVLLWVALLVLSVIGRGGLIGGILKADAEGAVSFKEAWALGRRYFWRLLAIYILEVLFIFALVLILILPIFGMILFPFAFLCICPLAILVFVAVLLLSLYMYLMQIAVVVENLSIGASFNRAWKVMQDNILPLLIFGVVVFIVGLLAELVMLVVSLPGFGLIVAGVLPLFTENGTINMPLIYTGVIVFLITLPIQWLIGAVLETWRTAVYTLAYKQFIQPPPPAPYPLTADQI